MMLGIPVRGGELHAESRGQLEHEGVVIEKWVFTAEPGSRVPALLYRPKQSSGKLPAIVFTYGHGSSKSAWSYHYAGLLYAKLGIVALAIDPIGEEERHLSGKMGSRAHDKFGKFHSMPIDEATEELMESTALGVMGWANAFVYDWDDIDAARSKPTSACWAFGDSEQVEGADENLQVVKLIAALGRGAS